MSSLITQVLIFLMAMVLLVKGSDVFVDASARLARKLGVSELAIGLTFVAVGTSMPELASSIIAAWRGVSEIVLGNIIGSNIANIFLVIGIAALIRPIRTNVFMVFRDGYILLFVTFLFYLFMWGHILPVYAGIHIISWVEGLFFLVLFFAYTFFIVERVKPMFGRSHLREFLDYTIRMRFITTIRDHLLRKRASSAKEKEEKEKARSLFREAFIKDAVFALFGLAALIIGAKYVVGGAVWAAQEFSIPASIIGMSAIALGTSLPELVVAISAVRQGFGDIAVGNVIGSNISNILLVGGTASLIAPINITGFMLVIFGPIMLFSTIGILVIMRTRWEVSRTWGFLLLFAYMLFIAMMASPLFLNIARIYG